MDLTKVLAGGAALGLVAGLWGKIKSITWRIASLLVQRVEVSSEAAHDALVAYLATRFKRSRSYDRMYGAAYEHQRDGRFGLVPYELLGHRSVLFWNGWRPFWFSNEKENKARADKPKNDSGDALDVYSTVTFLRGTLDVERLLREACERRNQLTWAVNEAEECTKNRFVIHHVPPRDGKEHDNERSGSSGLAWYQQTTYRLLGHKPEQLGKAPLHSGRALDNLIFPARVKELIREIELWRASRQWYRERGIPWKRGWLLYGPPGTGKTALARAFAEDLNMPIYVFNLAEMGNHDLIRTWTAMQVNTPCIALLEDFDNVFHGREYVARKNTPLSFLLPRPKDDDHGGDRPAPLAPLTFDCLLNCLDGVERSDGIFTIITTNDLGKIDPALGLPRTLPDGTVEFISTRPGRIDKAVELTFMEADDKKRMAQRILSEYEEPLRLMLEFVERFPDLKETPAQFQERCAQVALACFWKEQHDREATLPLQPAEMEETSAAS